MQCVVVLYPPWWIFWILISNLRLFTLRESSVAMSSIHCLPWPLLTFPPSIPPLPQWNLSSRSKVRTTGLVLRHLHLYLCSLIPMPPLCSLIPRLSGLNPRISLLHVSIWRGRVPQQVICWQVQPHFCLPKCFIAREYCYWGPEGPGLVQKFNTLFDDHTVTGYVAHNEMCLPSACLSLPHRVCERCGWRECILLASMWCVWEWQAQLCGWWLGKVCMCMCDVCVCVYCVLCVCVCVCVCVCAVCVYCIFPADAPSLSVFIYVIANVNWTVYVWYSSVTWTVPQFIDSHQPPLCVHLIGGFQWLNGSKPCVYWCRT